MKSQKRIIKKQIELLNLALESQAESTTIFNKSQTNLRKVISKRVARANHNLLISSVQNQEEPSSIDSISSSIATSDIISKYKQLL